MCLSTVYRGKEKEEALARLPVSGYYWKVVTVAGGKYHPLCNNEEIPYKIGWNTTKRTYGAEKYAVAYHLFRHEADAEYWLDFTWERLIRCKVEKKDIIHIGIQTDGGLCIVTTRFWCPKPKGDNK